MANDNLFSSLLENVSTWWLTHSVRGNGINSLEGCVWMLVCDSRLRCSGGKQKTNNMLRSSHTEEKDAWMYIAGFLSVFPATLCRLKSSEFHDWVFPFLLLLFFDTAHSNVVSTTFLMLTKFNERHNSWIVTDVRTTGNLSGPQFPLLFAQDYLYKPVAACQCWLSGFLGFSCYDNRVSTLRDS